MTLGANPTRVPVCPECGRGPDDARAVPVHASLRVLPAVLACAVLIAGALATLGWVGGAFPGAGRYGFIQSFGGPAQPMPVFSGELTLGDLRRAAAGTSQPPRLAHALATLRRDWSDLEPDRPIEVGFAPPQGRRVRYEVVGWPVPRREVFDQVTYRDVLKEELPLSAVDWTTMGEHSVMDRLAERYEVWLDKVGGAYLGQHYVRERRIDLPLVLTAVSVLAGLLARAAFGRAGRCTRRAAACAAAVLAPAALAAYGWNHATPSVQRLPDPRPGAMAPLGMTQAEVRGAESRDGSDLELARRLVALAPDDAADDWALLGQHQAVGTWATEFIDVGGEARAVTVSWQRRSAADGTPAPWPRVPARFDFDVPTGVLVTLPSPEGALGAWCVNIHPAGASLWLLALAGAWGAGRGLRGGVVLLRSRRRRRQGRCVACGYPLA